MTEASEVVQIKGVDKSVLLEWGELNKLSTQTPPSNLTIEGIFISTGDWTDRVHTALELWQKYRDLQGLKDAPVLIPSGLVAKRGYTIGGEVGKQQYNAPWMKAWFMRHGVPEGKILPEPEAKNSKELADFSLKISREHGLQNLILTLTSYYNARAFMTFVASILAQENPIQTRLFSVPSRDLPWDGFVPDEPKTRFQQIPAEITRIHAYQPKGDVATKEQLEQYINWLKEQDGK